MTAGTLSLNYTAPGTFTATVTAPPGYNLMMVTLSSPAGAPFQMMNMSGGANPSTWQCMAPSAAMPMTPGMPGGAGGAQTGTWTATAILQAQANCFGTTTVS